MKAVILPCVLQLVDLTAIEAHFLTVGEYNALEPDDLLAVGELIADPGDHVAGLHRRLGPAIGLHPIDGGTANLPFLHPSVTGLNFKGHPRVRLGPRKLDYSAFHCDKPVKAHRP